MRCFCTYFDHNYLIKGLALYDSLERHCPDFRLYVLCLSRGCFDALNTLGLAHIQPVSLAELEAYDPALLTAKGNRNLLEYYFTLTPVINLFVLETSDPAHVDMVTYLDSDLYFFDSPETLFDELGEGSVGIVEHRFSRKVAHLAAKFGTYNVAWMSFRRDDRAFACLRWYRERCLEWCRQVPEPTRFADQKYLDEWPHRFPGVRVLTHKGANVAPWNLANCTVTSNGASVHIDGQGLIFFHYQGFREVARGVYDMNLAPYRIKGSPVVRNAIFEPYIRAVWASGERVRTALPDFASKAGLSKHLGVVGRLKQTYRKLTKVVYGDYMYCAPWE